MGHELFSTFCFKTSLSHKKGGLSILLILRKPEISARETSKRYFKFWNLYFKTTQSSSLRFGLLFGGRGGRELAGGGGVPLVPLFSCLLYFEVIPRNTK